MSKVSDTTLLCNPCNSMISIEHGGVTDIKNHISTAKHANNIALLESTPKLTSFNVTSSKDTRITEQHVQRVRHTGVSNVQAKVKVKK